MGGSRTDINRHALSRVEPLMRMLLSEKAATQDSVTLSHHLATLGTLLVYLACGCGCGCKCGCSYKCGSDDKFGCSAGESVSVDSFDSLRPALLIAELSTEP
jgi:hypothetical protein